MIPDPKDLEHEVNIRRAVDLAVRNKPCPLYLEFMLHYPRATISKRGHAWSVSFKVSKYERTTVASSTKSRADATRKAFIVLAGGR